MEQHTTARNAGQRNGMPAQDFPLLRKRNLIYLDNSSTTQKPQRVIDAVQRYYEEENANVHRGIYRLSQKATMEYEQAHEVVAKFINARFEEIIFTRGTTESLNLLAYSLGRELHAGDEIILTEMEHHSNLVPWQQLVKDKNLVLKFIPLTSDGMLNMRSAKEMITSRTRIISVAHMSNVLGTINPVRELAELAHNVGAMMIVDAAQSVPHLKIDVQDLDCDFLAFSGHKMYGPTGIGVLFGRKELLETMSPFQFGGDMIKEVSFTHSTWNDLPWKFEAGTPHIAGASGLRAAIEYLQDVGMENIATHEKVLTTYAMEKLSSLPGVRILGPDADFRGPVIAFVMEGVHPHDASEILDRENIAVRGGHHCTMPLHSTLGLTSSLRVSFSLYNTMDDIDHLIQGLHKVREIFGT